MRASELKASKLLLPFEVLRFKSLAVVVIAISVRVLCVFVLFSFSVLFCCFVFDVVSLLSSLFIIAI